jgi:hypothetical protein
MTSNIRSASGGLLMLIIIPVIVGLLACMPVPIGDPERSRIDSEVTGVWVWLSNDEQAFYAFEPYDKRTWLLTGVPIEEGDEADLGNYELENYADLTRLIENETVGDDGATATEIVMYKAWRTRLGGEWFMTWEPKALFAEDGFEPEVWFAFRIDRPDENTLDLYFIEDKLFKDVEETRRAYERVIKKNVKNEDLYSEKPIHLVRVKPEHLSFFNDLASEVVSFD